MTEPFGQRLSQRAGAHMAAAVTWVGTRLDPIGDASAALETISFLDAFEPSLMPRTSEHQGLAAGLHVLGARLIGSRINAAQVLLLGANAGVAANLTARAVTFAAGQAASMLPDEDDETLWRSGARAGGQIVRAAAVSGALYDGAGALRAGSSRARSRPWVTAAMVSGGGLYWAGRRLQHRQAVIPRWPVEQKANIGKSTAIGAVVSAVGTGVGKTYLLTRRGAELYFGERWGRTSLARVVNAGLWTAGAVGAYNAGIAAIGRSNEKVEPAYATPPASPLMSGSADSLSRFAEIGLQGRRYVTDVVTPGMIEDVLGEPARAEPSRVYVGFNSIPLYGTGRAELALDELERTNAFDRPYLLLISPTGTGWVDQTVVEAAEFLARGISPPVRCSTAGSRPSSRCRRSASVGSSSGSWSGVFASGFGSGRPSAARRCSCSARASGRGRRAMWSWRRASPDSTTTASTGPSGSDCRRSPSGRATGWRPGRTSSCRRAPSASSTAMTSSPR